MNDKKAHLLCCRLGEYIIPNPKTKQGGCVENIIHFLVAMYKHQSYYASEGKEVLLR